MTKRRLAALALCFILLAGIAVWWALAQLRQGKPTPASLTDEEAMKMAAEVMRGERDEADLKKYGIRIGNPIRGGPARKHLLEELDALGKSKQEAPAPAPATGEPRTTP